MKIKSIRLRTDRRNPILIYRLVDGSERQETLRCDAKTAQKILRKKQNEIAQGDAGLHQHLATDISLIEFSEYYLQLSHARIDDQQAPLSKHEVRARYNALRIAYKVIGNAPVNRITAADVDGFIRVLLSSPTRQGNAYTPGAINTYLRRLAAAFEYLRREKIIDENPFRGKLIAGPRGKAAKPRYYSDEQLLVIGTHLADAPAWHNFAFLFSLQTGARVGGVLSANWHNIHLSSDVHFIELHEKGSKTRDVPLPANLYQMIQERIKAGGDSERYAEGYLLHEVTREDTISQMWLRHRRKWKFEGTFHWLRHTFARIYLERGGDIATLSELLGHEDIRTTSTFYGHISRRKKAQGIDALVYTLPGKSKIVRMG